MLTTELTKSYGAVLDKIVCIYCACWALAQQNSDENYLFTTHSLFLGSGKLLDFN